MSLPKIGDFMDVHTGDGVIMRVEVFRHDKHRGFYIVRIVNVRRDPATGDRLGKPQEENPL
jgi:hypothetical protein